MTKLLTYSFLTTDQAARILKVGAPEVRYLIRAGRLKARRFGNAYAIEEKDLKRIKYLRVPTRR